MSLKKPNPNSSDNEVDFEETQTVSDVVVDKYGNVLQPVIQRHVSRKPGRHCLSLLKTILKHIFSTLLIVGYLIAGGFLFQALELNNESEDCMIKQKNYLLNLNSSASRILGKVLSTTDKNLAANAVTELLIKFAKDMYVLDFEPTKNCDVILKTTDKAKWNLINSIYFCVTIVTTIGYGHISPTTFWGRLICIIYAIIGIPLMLIYLAIIGNMLARLFRFVFINLVCCRCFYDFVHFKRQKRKERLREWAENLCLHEEEEARRRGLPLRSNPLDDIFIEDEDSEDDDIDRMDTSKLNVPLFISITIMCGYTLIGAIIFPIWEDWSISDAAYFSFITISTIGFGDLVPGNGRLNDSVSTELLVGSCYMIVGLSLLSMCLNLVKDELLAKFKYLLNCFRKSDDKKIDDDDEEEEGNHQLDNDGQIVAIHRAETIKSNSNKESVIKRRNDQSKRQNTMKNSKVVNTIVEKPASSNASSGLEGYENKSYVQET